MKPISDENFEVLQYAIDVLYFVCPFGIVISGREWAKLIRGGYEGRYCLLAAKLVNEYVLTIKRTNTTREIKYV